MVLWINRNAYFQIPSRNYPARFNGYDLSLYVKAPQMSRAKDRAFFIWAVLRCFVRLPRRPLVVGCAQKGSCNYACILLTKLRCIAPCALRLHGVHSPFRCLPLLGSTAVGAFFFGCAQKGSKNALVNTDIVRKHCKPTKPECPVFIQTPRAVEVRSGGACRWQ
jgi:hypothetical protein